MLNKSISLIVVLFIFFNGIKLIAQDSKPIGLTGGITLANVYGDDTENNSTKAGMAFGFFLNHKINKILSFHPEILLSNKGFDYYNQDIVVDGNSKEYFTSEGDWDITYLDLNSLVKISIPRKGDVKPIVYFGPNFSLNIVAKHNNSETHRIDVNEVTIYRSKATDSWEIKNFRKLDIGVILGLGFELENFSLDMRYNVGFLKILTGEQETNIKNQIFSLMVGYFFK